MRSCCQLASGNSTVAGETIIIEQPRDVAMRCIVLQVAVLRLRFVRRPVRHVASNRGSRSPCWFSPVSIDIEFLGDDHGGAVRIPCPVSGFFAMMVNVLSG